MSGLDPNVIVDKLIVSEAIKLIKQPQRYFCPKLMIQRNAEVDKLIKVDFIHED